MSNEDTTVQEEFGSELDPIGCHRLIEDIVYHAVKDLEVLNNSRRAVYADDDHKAMCKEFDYGSGMAELRHFFYSPWFSFICDFFVDISEEEILNNIDLSVRGENEFGNCS